MQKRVLIGAFASAALSVAASAAGNPADYNGDGRISREEFRNQAAKVAFEADKNSNGAIDGDEIKFNDDQRKALDTDGDGKVSVEEFQAGNMSGFDQADKNGDGFLDAQEMKGG
jgi:Ca2+-binding EF-hand superfamily protein